MSLTEAEVFEEVKARLGGSEDRPKVELTETDYKAALKSAIRMYSRANPLRDQESVTVPATGIRAIDVHPETYAVTEVEFQDQLNVLEGRDSLSFNVFNSWQIIGAGMGGGGGGLGDTFEYALLKQWRDLTRREFSLEPDYYWEQDVQYDETDDTTVLPRKLHFFNPGGLSLRASYVCHRKRPLSAITPQDEDWIIDWTTAESKEILGRKRNKHKKIPTAGQLLELDGADLLQEAREEKLALREDLKSRFIGKNMFQWG